MPAAGNVISIRRGAQRLDDRIASALDGALSSNDLMLLLLDIEQASRQAKAASLAATDRAIDPMVRPAEFAAARRTMDDTNLRAIRLDAAAEQLKTMLSSALTIEACQYAEDLPADERAGVAALLEALEAEGARIEQEQASIRRRHRADMAQKDAEKAVILRQKERIAAYVDAAGEQYMVDPDTGDFPELAEIEKLRAAGRLTAEDIAALADADAVMVTANAYVAALKVFAECEAEQAAPTGIETKGAS
jgi:hypothetical protein